MMMLASHVGGDSLMCQHCKQLGWLHLSDDTLPLEKDSDEFNIVKANSEAHYGSHYGIPEAFWVSLLAQGVKAAYSCDRDVFLGKMAGAV